MQPRDHSDYPVHLCNTQRSDDVNRRLLQQRDMPSLIDRAELPRNLSAMPLPCSTRVGDQFGRLAEAESALRVRSSHCAGPANLRSRLEGAAECLVLTTAGRHPPQLHTRRKQQQQQ